MPHGRRRKLESRKPVNGRDLGACASAPSCKAVSALPISTIHAVPCDSKAIVVAKTHPPNDLDGSTRVERGVGIVQMPQRSSARQHFRSAAYTASYAYSLEGGETSIAIGGGVGLFFEWWKDARPAVFVLNTDSTAKVKGYVDADWVHYRPLD